MQPVEILKQKTKCKIELEGAFVVFGTLSGVASSSLALGGDYGRCLPTPGFLSHTRLFRNLRVVCFSDLNKAMWTVAMLMWQWALGKQNEEPCWSDRQDKDGKCQLTPMCHCLTCMLLLRTLCCHLFCTTTVSAIHGYSQIHREFNWFVAFPTADDEVVLWLLKGEGNLISMQRWDEVQHSVNWQTEILLQNSLFDVEDNGENLNLWKSAVGQNTIRPLKS